MDTKHNIKKATQMLKSQGPIALLKAFKRYVTDKYGPYRPDESKIAFSALNADKFKGLMIDVGAHYGSAMSQFVHSGWQVIAFEPDSKNRSELIRFFGNSQAVTIDSRAVSDHTQRKAVLYRSEESTGISGLSSFHHSHRVGEEVEVTTLSHVFDERDLKNNVSFLKIDTEGFDLHVLRGFPWSKASPDLILCEFEDAKTVPLGYSFQDLAKYLVERDYKLVVSEWYPIERYGFPHDWRRFATYPCELEDSKSWGNIFATKKDEIYNSLLSICNHKSF